MAGPLRLSWGFPHGRQGRASREAAQIQVFRRIARVPNGGRAARSVAWRGTNPWQLRWVEVDIIGWIFEQVPFLAPLMESEVLLGLTFVALTAALLGMGVPGVLVPMSLSSGALLGGWEGMLVVMAGA